MSLFVVAEGEGDRAALPVLIDSVRRHLQLKSLPYIPSGGCAVDNLHFEHSNLPDRLEKCCERYRPRAVKVKALLIAQDSDSLCPKSSAVEAATLVRGKGLPFPVAIVFFYREFETFFLAGVATMAGRPLKMETGRELPGLSPDPPPVRAIETMAPVAWINAQRTRKYKKTIEQVLFTRLLDHEDPNLQALSSYRRLCAALSFLDRHVANGSGSGAVYPPSLSPQPTLCADARMP